MLFDGLGEEQRQLVRSLGRTKTYATNVVICSKGAEANELYLVEEGQVNVQSGAEEGVHINISVVSAGEAFAWSALVPPYRLTATVVATSPTRVLAIERHKLLTAMRDDSFLALTLMQNVARIAASRLHNLEQELVAILRR
ncbi:MAG: cyclic nucleotide-binding domain-containing protein [Chloroflexi bacterium]|nr:cyclic nucleotide-binding domain-containing protein [Chloroflexota bacterium]